MYLGHDEYEAMGGTLDSSAFFIYSRRAEYMIRSQAGGQTGERIDNLSEIPEAVKDCIFDLVSFLSNYAGDKQMASESQSQGGTSESYSYVTKTDAEISERCGEIIGQYFYGGGLGHLLYRGACM